MHLMQQGRQERDSESSKSDPLRESQSDKQERGTKREAVRAASHASSMEEEQAERSLGAPSTYRPIAKEMS